MLRRNLVGYLTRRRLSDVSAVAAPKYPQILDLSEGSVRKRGREQYRDKVNSLETVEEKLFYQNLEHFYGAKCFVLKEAELPLGAAEFSRYVTRTRVVGADEKLFRGLVRGSSRDVEGLLERIRPYLQEGLLFELLGRRREQLRGSELSGAVVERVNDVLLNCLATEHPHLLEAVVDLRPRVEAYWLAGDFHPGQEIVEERREKKRELVKENKTLVFPKPVDIDLAETVEHRVQFQSSPLVQLRSEHPLAPLDTALVAAAAAEEEEEAAFLSEPFYSPVTAYGLQETRRHGVNLPGCWPGDQCDNGLLAYHHLHDESHLTDQAVFCGFSSLLAQAALKGFSTYSELTYPLATQQVFTDGRRFAFSLYQLNTTITHKLTLSPNTRTNLSVTLAPQELYKSVENNKFVGWNDSVLLTLLALYLNPPSARSDLRPNLPNPAVTHLSHVEPEEKRVWLHDHFRNMYSNRPRYWLPYEIYDWERIYKIKFKTRPMDARRRPFELDQDPAEERKYWDYLQPYVPRSLRPRKKMYWNGWRGKRAKSFFPEP